MQSYHKKIHLIINYKKKIILLINKIKIIQKIRKKKRQKKNQIYLQISNKSKIYPILNPNFKL
jgi:hypothetical protein